jgi:hypothetical protein
VKEAGALTGGGAVRGVGGSNTHRRGGVRCRRKRRSPVGRRGVEEAGARDRVGG